MGTRFTLGVRLRGYWNASVPKSTIRISTPKNYVKLELKGLRWNNYLDAWIERQAARREAGEISREYLRMIQSLAKNHIREMFGNRSIRDLTKGIIEGGYVTIAAAMDQNEYRPCTKEREVRVLSINGECLAEIETLPRSFTGFIFTFRGKPLHKEFVNASWRRAAKKAGVNISCYQGTRHSLISQLLNAGYSEALVRQIAGDRCESTIQRYRHIKAESLRPLIERQQTVSRQQEANGNILKIKR